MEKKIIIMLGILCLGLIVGIGIFMMDKKTDEEVGCTMDAQICPDGSVVGRSGPACAFAPCSESFGSPKNPENSDAAENNPSETQNEGAKEKELIYVISPLPESTIKSPLHISGKARGTWYFEGSFPVSLMREDGVVIGRGIAQAEGEWMTTEFVPFEATIDFALPSSGKGSLILTRDNPSGLPENDAQIIIPLRF